MNAYMDRTFIIDSVNEWLSRYYAENNNYKDFAKYSSAELTFINLLNNEKHVIPFVLGPKSNLVQGLVHVWFKESSLPPPDSKFYETNVTDSYGRGNTYHSYGLWLIGAGAKEAILRGKAMFVKAGK